MNYVLKQYSSYAGFLPCTMRPENCSEESLFRSQEAIFSLILDAHIAQREYDRIDMDDEEGSNKASEKIWEAESAVFECSPKTLRGLLAKLEFLAAKSEDFDECDRLSGVVAQLPHDLSDLLRQFKAGTPI